MGSIDAYNHLFTNSEWSFSTSYATFIIFKQIPEFHQLNLDDKVTSIKYNLTIVLYLNRALSYNIETGQITETDSDAPFDTQFFQLIHGYNIY
jgi:hypothetical protein